MSSISTVGRSITAILLCATFVLSACSIPNLEGQQCTEARDEVREFYSWYMGMDAAAREKQRDVYNRYIAPDFQSTAGSNADPFYLSDTIPTTFKIGKCDQKDDSHITMQIQLYWRQDRKTDQKEVYADMTKAGDKWLIDKVESR
jgi:hypothetical protein